MKLKNRKTGEIVDLLVGSLREISSGGQIAVRPVAALSGEYVYNSLAELYEEWEDYEEPKEYWMINAFGDVETVSGIYTDDMTDELREIGNYFSSKEEAELAVEKLKAWKRLEDYGVRFCSWFYDIEKQEIKIKAEFKEFEEVIVGQNRKDLDLLFGGEE